MDENFFLYFECIDTCLRLRNQGKKFYVVDNLKFTHYGTQSSLPSMKFDIEDSSWYSSGANSKDDLLKFISSRLDYLMGSRPTAVDLSNAIKLLKKQSRKNQGESHIVPISNACHIKRTTFGSQLGNALGIEQAG